MLSTHQKRQERFNTGYRPRPLQRQIHSELKRFNVLVLHRRAGKTVLSINQMIHKGLKNGLYNPQYAYFAPTYKQAKRVAWEYLVQYTRNIPGAEVNKSDLSVTIQRKARIHNGEHVAQADKITFMLIGADDPDSIRGIYLDGGILDEFAQCDPIVWGEIVRPALADRRGWAIFIGTPKGKNHFHDRYKFACSDPSWYSRLVTAEESGIIPAEELEAMKREMTTEQYEQEMLCSFTAAVLGSFYGQLLNQARDDGRIGKVPYDPHLPVDTFWDLGMNDSTAIWFRQRTNSGMYRYIDYYENNNEALDHYVQVINKKDYSFGRHVLPWDAQARDLGTGHTRQETLRKLGLRCEIQSRQNVADRIEASRARIGVSWFDEQKCARGLEALDNYQKEWDSKKMIFKDKPLHDWTSHAADSFGYSAMDDRGGSFADDYGADLPREALGEYDELDY